MSESMKVLLGYDGSDCANAAIDDLAKAGLPSHTEIRAVTYIDIGAHLREWPHGPARVQQDLERTLKESEQLAAAAAQRLRAQYPGWQVHAETLCGSPSRGLVEESERWGADLIVVGSHGRSALGRAFLGSCSQMVLAHATKSVRVSRRSSQHPAGEAPRLVLATDGSDDAAHAVRAVADRAWPAGTTVDVVGVLDLSLVGAVPMGVSVCYASDAGGGASPVPDVAPAGDVPGMKWLREATQAAADELAHAGLSVKQVVREGDPKHQILEEAESVGANCIFLGSRGLNRFERFMMGSVSTAVAARARCSVEVVR